MKEHIRNDRDNDQRDRDDDQLRSNTMNETIREASGDPDADLNDMKDADDEFDRTGRIGSENYGDIDRTSGTAGLDTGRVTRDLGSHRNTKTGLTGSEFDGQDV